MLRRHCLVLALNREASTPPPPPFYPVAGCIEIRIVPGDPLPCPQPGILVQNSNETRLTLPLNNGADKFTGKPEQLHSPDFTLT